MLRDVESADPKFRNIPIYLSRYGLRVWESSVEVPAKGRRKGR